MRLANVISLCRLSTIIFSLLVEFFLGWKNVYGFRFRESTCHFPPQRRADILYSRMGGDHGRYRHGPGTSPANSRSSLASEFLKSVFVRPSVDFNSVKTTLVSLMGLPRITISVLPLSKLMPNIMDLPFISGFISSALDTAAAEYVAPKSLTLDLQRLISGDDIKKGMTLSRTSSVPLTHTHYTDTDAVGVLVVHIHRATGVKSMDAITGSSGL